MSDFTKNWTLCERKLPESGEAVLAKTARGETGVLRFDSDYYRWHTTIGATVVQHSEVVAWMPLPSPSDGFGKTDDSAG